MNPSAYRCLCVRMPSSSHLPALIANTFPEAGPDTLLQGSLFALGFILFVVSFFVLAIARVFLRQGRMAA